MSIEPSKNRLTSRRRKLLYACAILLSASALFFGGWGIGNGRISFGNLKPAISSQPRQLNYDSVDELYEAILKNFDGEIDTNALLDGLKQGLAKATGDPYTEYFNDEASQDFNEQLSGSFSGIGAELGKDGTNLVIIAPIADSPAEEAGLKPKDIIVAIDDEPAQDITISEAVDKIRGEAGTQVKLTIVRDGQSMDKTIMRKQITVPSVKWEIKDGVGILSVSRFWDDTAELARQAAKEFKAAGVNKVVLDLRNNPGGSLGSAVELSSLWLDNGQTVLQEKRGGKVVSTFKASGTPVFKGIKTAVLINDGSASASEIVAGALQDHKAATLVGIKSYGKGSVQQVIELGGGGSVKVTIARWYTPNDKNIDKQGIEPDQKVELSTDDANAGRDPQMDAAVKAVQ